MKQELAVFNNEQFGEIRTVNISGEPWFVAADVCRALEIVNHKDALSRLDEDEKSGVGLTDPHGREQITNVINEPGLYSLILSSRKPEARLFKRWITHEIIPSIRKTGSYAMNGRVHAEINADKTKFEMGLLAVKATADLVNASEVGRLIMMDKFCKSAGVDTSFLPEYGSNGSTEGGTHFSTHVQMSLTELLKKNKCAIKPAAFNKMLVADGYLDERERPSSKKDKDGNTITKRFKVLTKKGLSYGTNMVSRHNARETQPLYFEDTFMDLYGKVMG